MKKVKTLTFLVIIGLCLSACSLSVSGSLSTIAANQVPKFNSKFSELPYFRLWIYYLKGDKFYPQLIITQLKPTVNEVISILEAGPNAQTGLTDLVTKNTIEPDNASENPYQIEIRISTAFYLQPQRLQFLEIGQIVLSLVALSKNGNVYVDDANQEPVAIYNSSNQLFYSPFTKDVFSAYID